MIAIWALSTSLHLQWMQHPVVMRSSLVTFPAHFPQTSQWESQQGRLQVFLLSISPYALLHLLFLDFAALAPCCILLPLTSLCLCCIATTLPQLICGLHQTSQVSCDASASLPSISSASCLITHLGVTMETRSAWIAIAKWCSQWYHLVTAIWILIAIITQGLLVLASLTAFFIRSLYCLYYSLQYFFFFL